MSLRDSTRSTTGTTSIHESGARTGGQQPSNEQAVTVWQNCPKTRKERCSPPQPNWCMNMAKLRAPQQRCAHTVQTPAQGAPYTNSTFTLQINLQGVDLFRSGLIQRTHLHCVYTVQGIARFFTSLFLVQLVYVIQEITNFFTHKLS